MTGLIAASIGLIVLSAVALVLGWAGARETLIYLSILCSIGAAVTLALAFYKSKSASPSEPAGTRTGSTKTDAP